MRKKSIIFPVAALSLVALAANAVYASEADRLSRSIQALRIFEEKAPAVADGLLKNAVCVGVIPRVQEQENGGPGLGIVSCRLTPAAAWGTPASIQISGGGMIWDLAGTRMDVVLMVTGRDAPKIMSRDSVVFGVDLSAYPGPLRNVSASDPPIGTGVFAWSISDGDLQPVALGGATVTRSPATKAADKELRDFFALLPRSAAVPSPLRPATGESRGEY